MENEKSIGAWSLFALWFGAAISVAEIMTGALLAPLGLGTGIWVIVGGHLLGCIILGLVGLIGFRERKPSFIAARISFGKHGSVLISIFNILQLIGWTAIMMIQCAKSIEPLIKPWMSNINFSLLVVAIGVLIGFWVFLNDRGLHGFNTIAVVLLALLSIFMLTIVFQNGAVKQTATNISIGMAIELSLVMPLSWVPLVADYTMRGKTAKGTFWGSFLGYFLGSCLMYVTGLIAALYGGTADPFSILSLLHFGLLAFFILVLSTVTTAFLDVYSAVLSTLNLSEKLSKRRLILIFTGLGTLLALFFPMEAYTNFLYLIGSLFAPAFTVFLMDYYLFRSDYSEQSVNVLGMLSSLAGTGLYYVFEPLDLIIGTSIPAMLASAVLYALFYNIKKYKIKGEKKYVRTNPS